MLAQADKERFVARREKQNKKKQKKRDFKVSLEF